MLNADINQSESELEPLPSLSLSEDSLWRRFLPFLESFLSLFRSFLSFLCLCLSDLWDLWAFFDSFNSLESFLLLGSLEAFIWSVSVLRRALSRWIEDSNRGSGGRTISGAGKGPVAALERI